MEQLRQRVAQLEAELAQKNEELTQIIKSRKSEQVSFVSLTQSGHLLFEIKERI